MSTTAPTLEFIRGLPKAELHLHIEGTLEPEMAFALAERNGIALGYESPAELRAAYQFSGLQSFLDIYYATAVALVNSQDFYDLTWAYLQRAAQAGVVRAEIFFDPQTHTSRGVPFAEVIEGVSAALAAAPERLGVSTGLIMCFLRHLSPEEAMSTLEEALPYQDKLLGVGLDSGEAGRPPSLFVPVYQRAKTEGLRLVAHAGEEGPADYVRQALDLLEVERIEHGFRSIDDPDLVSRLASEEIPLTSCPTSNLALGIFSALNEHPLYELWKRGVKVTLNSDDPAFFDAYVDEVYLQVAEAFGISVDELGQLARNSLEATFLPPAEKADLLDRHARYMASAMVGG